MPAGAKPGERRGGRGKGTINKDKETIQQFIARMEIKPHQTLGMISENKLPCPFCRGEGKFIKTHPPITTSNITTQPVEVSEPCKDCKGTGREAVPAMLRFKAAAELEQYVSAKLRSIEVTGAAGGPIKTRHELVFVKPGFDQSHE